MNIKYLLILIITLALTAFLPISAENINSADNNCKCQKTLVKNKKTAKKHAEYVSLPNSDGHISIGYTTVTNAEYAKFASDTGRNVQLNQNNKKQKKKQNFPVVNVTYNDAVEYCNWLTKKDKNAIYRLPTEEEWESFAGNMPINGKFNSGLNKGIKSAFDYKKTVSVSGAINMWGNVWEWTSTPRIKNAGIYSANMMAVKGGAWNSSVVNCNTNYRLEARNPDSRYDNVGFRVVREKKVLY